MFNLSRNHYLLLLVMWSGLILAWLFGHEIIKAIYDGNASVFNRLIQGQSHVTFEEYYALYDTFIRLALTLAILLTLGSPILNWIFKVENRIKPFRLTDLYLFIYISLLCLITFSLGMQGYIDNNNWRIGDWLINYQAGFVRRGLLGEAYLWLWKTTGTEPAIYVLLTQIVCYFAFFLFLGLLLRRQESLLPFLLLIVSPFIFAFHLHDLQGGFRKEILYLALLPLFSWLAITTSQFAIRTSTVLVMLVYPVLILSHEMLAVFLPYFLSIYVASTNRSLKPDLLIGILLAFSIAAFYAAVTHAGSNQHVEIICDSLNPHAVHHCKTEGAISALARSTEYGLNAVRDGIQNQGYFLKYATCLLLALLAFVPILNRFQFIKHNWLASLLILSSILGTIPLFIVAIDWGRFLHIHLVSLLVILLINPATEVNPKALVARAGGYIDGVISKGNFSSLILYLGILFLLILYALSWHIPHTGMDEIWLHHLPL
ncbi:MAG: hypothetical protein AB2746_13915 [Candidatus Thiodiazotropha taylori]